MPDSSEAQAVVMRKDAALADQQAAFGHHDGEPLAGGQADLEGAQVAVVDAKQPGPQRQGPFHLGLVMHLDEGVHAEFEGRLLQRPGLVVGQRRHDDQDGIGTPGAGFVDLVGFEHEILAQRRQPRRRAGAGQVFRRALEGRAVGQHREAGGAAAFVGRGQCRRVEILADQALGGTGLLDLGDEAEPSLCLAVLQRREKAARRAPGRAGRPSARQAAAPSWRRRFPGACRLRFSAECRSWCPFDVSPCRRHGRWRS